MTIRLGHVCLGTSRLDAMVDFYRRELDCSLVHEFLRPDGTRYGVFLGAGNGTFLELFHDDDAKAGGSFRHLAFQVEDIEAAAAHFAKLGQTTEVKRGRTDGALQCWAWDPDGNAIEFHQYDAESVQLAFLPAA